ncbi:MFS transporter [Microbulbifer thermotolerans]|uniref:MFS transporter n=1 Tax=Microbulbifer thermotolerans TaxID=252514 RepID=A0AB35HVW6_MICTH|nr:MFS transporter [Microbulbifer thermotolerans]MCX2781034.1 MFS transporter [Microbulbifer thermotolerans]MCX2782137.1 MFS transporter [Microbulbifer thermotolerans]MCX2796061.1 MFS transporter [Microbulbifer thermotolerans]MCX2801203.1 MFS transporter [Microbulbifer thermotolerans]MCX2804571.1 MFS transporter [Microbulbifer thermotolerans]
MSNNAESLANDAGTTPQKAIENFPHAAPQGWIASLLLAFLSSAGLYYVNIFPVIVNSLMTGAGLSAAQAGEITFANTMGAVIGAFLISILVKKIPQWKLAAFVLLLCSIGMDLLTIVLANLELLIPLRLVHGMLGGALVGLGFAVIARSGIAGRTYSMVLLVQYIGGALGLRFLPELVALYGTYVPFFALITFSLVTLAMLPFLADYPLPSIEEQKKAVFNAKVALAPMLITLVALFCFQLSNMALFAFIFDLGKSFGLPLTFISQTLFWANLVAIGGAALAAYTGQRFALAPPLAIALLVTLVGLAMFIFSDLKPVFVAANIITGITWAFCVPYFLTMASRFDAAGQMGAFGGFASKTGLACGPLAAGYFISAGGSYTQLIAITCGILVVCLAALPAASRLDRAAG